MSSKPMRLLAFATRSYHNPFYTNQKRIKDWKIVREDVVEVVSGKHQGQKGKVLKVNKKLNTVTVQGVNYSFKTVKDEEYVARTKVVQVEMPLHLSKVALIDPDNNHPTKVTIGFLEDGTKVRVAKSGAVVDKPDLSHLKYVERVKDKVIGPHDTVSADVFEKSYVMEDFTRVKAEFDEYIRMKEEKEDLLVFK